MYAVQVAFKRHEKKYLLTPRQYASIRVALQAYLCDDQYGLHTINNIYFDTPDFAMIRYSLTHPVYKEKFRLRCYGQPNEEQPLFAEIKKKYKHVVYKNRIAASASEIREMLQGGFVFEAEQQTQREIHWLFRQWRPIPQVYIGYDRIACYGRENTELRVTFDQNLRFRTSQLDCSCGDTGQLILPQETIIMEVKFPQTSPLWMAHLLSEYGIFPCSFSKYGTCFTRHLQRTQVMPLTMKAERITNVYSAL